MPLTNAEIDAAVPVAGEPSRALVNAALKEAAGDIAAVSAEIAALQQDVTNLVELAINVHDPEYGAIGDGVADDTIALQAAFDAGISLGRPVMLKPGSVYNVAPQVSGGNAFEIQLGDKQSLNIFCPVRRAAKIVYHTFGGNNPEAGFEIINGQVWRGSVFNIVGPTSSGNVEQAKEFKIKWVEVDGNIANANEDNINTPANPSTGSGWDLTNKGFQFLSGVILHLQFEDCLLHSFRGEIGYQAVGYRDQTIVAIGCEVHSTNANALNFGIGSHRYYSDNFIYNLGNDAFEDAVGVSGHYINNRIYDCRSGILAGQYTNSFTIDTAKPMLIHGNLIAGCGRGIVFQGYAANIADNYVIDSSDIQIAVNSGIAVTVWNANRSGISVQNNTLMCNEVSPTGGIQITASTGLPVSNIYVQDNIFTSLSGSPETHKAAFIISRNSEVSGLYIKGNIVDSATNLCQDTSIDLVSQNMPCFSQNIVNIRDNYKTLGEVIAINDVARSIYFVSQKAHVIANRTSSSPSIIGSYTEGHQVELLITTNPTTGTITLPAQGGQWLLSQERVMKNNDKILLEYRSGRWRDVQYMPAETGLDPALLSPVAGWDAEQSALGGGLITDRVADNALTVQGGVSKYATGFNGKPCFVFSGGFDHAFTSTPILSGLDEFSIVMLVAQNAAITNSFPLSEAATVSTSATLSLTSGAANAGEVSFVARDNSNNQLSNATPTGRFPFDGLDRFLTITVDKLNDAVRIYVDDQAVVTQTTSGLDADYSDIDRFTLGGFLSSSLFQVWKGQIAACWLYDKRLGEVDIQGIRDYYLAGGYLPQDPTDPGGPFPWDDIATPDLDVYLIAGQSNTLFSTGLAENPDQFVDPKVFMSAFSGVRTVPAIEPMLGTDPQIDTQTIGFGVAGGKAYTAINGRYVIFVHAGVGGTGFVSNQWNPGDKLYADAIANVNKVLAAHPKATFRGVWWHQGEQDAVANVTEAAHAANLDAMIAGMRAAITGGASSMFVLGGMADDFVAGNSAQRQPVQDALIDTPNRVTNCSFVSATGLATSDNIHFTAAAARSLGALYATAADTLLP